MGLRQVILEGKDYDKLVDEAAQKLGRKTTELKIDILESKKTMFSTYFKIKATEKEIVAADPVTPAVPTAVEEKKDDVPEKTGLYKVISFDFREDGVYLKYGFMNALQDVLNEIDRKKVENVDIPALKKDIIAGKADTWLRIAPPQVEQKIDYTLDVQIPPDFMKVYINLKPALGGVEANIDTIRKFIKDRRIVFGVKEDVIKNIFDKKLFDQEILIAEGKEPTEGKDASLEYYFDAGMNKSFKIDNEGKIDFHEVSQIKNIEKGAKLVRMVAGIPGEPGLNVLGAVVTPKEVKKMTLPRGKNVELAEDGVTLVAGKAGEVKLIDGKVHVFSVYEVKSNVDNSTGNIRFAGKVIINGNVLTGFEIEAEGDIEVYGVVEGAKISAGGNIILHRGMLGANRGQVYCEGDLVAKFIENSSLDVKGNIHSDAIMHSNVICGKKVEIAGKKGLLVGGSIMAGEEIKAKIIGSPMATVTEIEVGINPDIRRKYDNLKEELKQTSDNYEKTRQAVDLLTKMSQKVELPEDKKVLLSRSIQMKTQLYERVEEIKAEQTELEVYFEDVSKGKIKVMETIYPGSKLAIGSSKMFIKDPLQFVTFYRANAEIKMTTYEK